MASAAPEAARVAWAGLLWTLVRTDFKSRYHGTACGFLWALLKPATMFLVLVAVFSLVFSSEPTYKLDLIIGLFLWIPRVLRAVLGFSVALVHSTLTETNAEAAGRRLRSAANFYRRGFVSAVESIRPPKATQEDRGEERGSKETVQ